jgi:two-component system CheB/CheR fusion protein
MKVLVIEDSSDVRLLLELELTARGYAVVTADSAESGLAVAMRERPAVVVSDLGLPGLDGIELVRRLRADPLLAGTPAIALSGFGARTEVQEALAAGYGEALIKPIDPDALARAIERSLSESPLEYRR